jgi:hypothetical protein
LHTGRPRPLTFDRGFAGVARREFAETFYNDLSNPTPSCEGGEEPPPAVPTTKEQCKDRGFEDFPALGFRNQGECVAFVERDSKNEEEVPS